MQCVADDDLVVVDQGALLEQRLQSGEPYLVVAHRQIFSRWAVLAYEARHVDIPAARGARGQREREGALLPVGVEHRLVLLRRDRPKAVQAAHVLRAVHFKSFGCFGNPVPIMESRVTSSASFSSLQPSVPAGRIGMTRYRISAVESHTRISVSFGRLTPKSLSTPRGSATARERSVSYTHLRAHETVLDLVCRLL